MKTGRRHDSQAEIFQLFNDLICKYIHHLLTPVKAEAWFSSRSNLHPNYKWQINATLVYVQLGTSPSPRQRSFPCRTLCRVSSSTASLKLSVTRVEPVLNLFAKSFQSFLFIF